MVETVITTEMYNTLLRKYELSQIHLKQAMERITELHNEIELLNPTPEGEEAQF